MAGSVAEEAFELLAHKYKDVRYVLGHNLTSSRAETSSHMEHTLSSEVSIIEELIKHFKQGEALIESYALGDRVLFDPSFGFSKTHQQNLELLKYLDKLIKSFPRSQQWLIGISRKSFLQKLTNTNNGQDTMQGCDALQSLVILKEYSRLNEYKLLWRLHTAEAFEVVGQSVKLYD